RRPHHLTPPLACCHMKRRPRPTGQSICPTARFGRDYPGRTRQTPVTSGIRLTRFIHANGSAAADAMSGGLREMIVSSANPFDIASCRKLHDTAGVSIDRRSEIIV